MADTRKETNPWDWPASDWADSVQEQVSQPPRCWHGIDDRRRPCESPLSHFQGRCQVPHTHRYRHSAVAAAAAAGTATIIIIFRFWHSFLELLQVDPGPQKDNLGQQLERASHRMDAFPATRPAASKHWMELKTLAPTMEDHSLVSSFLDWTTDSQRKGHCTL